MSCSRVVLVIVLALFVTAVASPVRAGTADAPLMTRDADLLVSISSFETLYGRFGIDSLRDAYPERTRELSDEMRENIGVDLLDLRALREAGLDLNRPIHVGLYFSPQVVVAAFPGGEGAWERVVRPGGELFPTVRSFGGIRMAIGSDRSIASFHTDGYLVFVSTGADDDKQVESAPDAAVRLQEESKEHPLGKSQRFLNAVRGAHGGGDIRVWAGPNIYLGRGPGSVAGISGEASKEKRDRLWKKWGIENSAIAWTVNIGDDRLEAWGSGWMKKGSPLADVYRPGVDPLPFVSRLATSAWWVSLGRVNGNKLWDFVQELMREEGEQAAGVDKGLDKLGAEFGVDVERDIIRRIDGNVGLLIDSATLSGADATLFVQFREAKKIARIVDEITKGVQDDVKKKSGDAPDGKPRPVITKERVGGNNAWRVVVPPMFEAGYGMIDDHFVVTTSWQRFLAIAAGGSGLPEALGDAGVRESLNDPTGGVLFVDFAGPVRDLGPMAPMMGAAGEQVVDALRLLDHCVSTTTYHDEGSRSWFLLKAVRPGLWPRLAGLALGFEK